MLVENSHEYHCHSCTANQYSYVVHTELTATVLKILNCGTNARKSFNAGCTAQSVLWSSYCKCNPRWSVFHLKGFLVKQTRLKGWNRHMSGIGTNISQTKILENRWLLGKSTERWWLYRAPKMQFPYGAIFEYIPKLHSKNYLFRFIVVNFMRM